MCAVWEDKDYRALSLADQGLFAGLLAYPQISYCGVIDWIPSRLVKLSDELDRTKLAAGVNRLGAASFLCLDPETDELLIRRFMYWDGVLGVKNVGKAMVTAYNRVQSEFLREAIVMELSRIWAEDDKLHGWEGVREMAPDFMGEIEGGATC
jgi:hypothetical protein